MSRHDPTGTTLIRRRFMNQILRRTRDLVKDIMDLVVGLDVFGLAPSREPFTINIEREAWRFLTDDRKLGEFQKWFQGQVDLGLLSVDPITGDPWTAEFVDSSYRKGVVDAFNKTRKTAGQEAGFVAGSQEEFLRSAFASPEAVSKIRLLSTRTFEQLKGITGNMSQGIARELASGLASGLGPREIARRITQNISGISRRRALVISRTEIINVHAEGSLDSFEKLGVEELNLMSEFSTTGDDRVCPLCAPLEGTVFTIKEARGIIPRHPNCRCAWIPANVGEKDKKGRAVTEEQVKARVEASLKAELPLGAKNRTLGAAKRRSSSPLKSVSITKRSPTLVKDLGPGTKKSIFESAIVKERRAKLAAKKKAAILKKPVKPKKPPKPKPLAETVLDRDKKVLKKLQDEDKEKALELRKTESRIETKKKELKSIQDETKKIEDKRKEDLKEISDIKKDIKRVKSETKKIEKALALEDKGGPPAIETVKKIEAEKAKIKVTRPQKIPPLIRDTEYRQFALKEQNRQLALITDDVGSKLDRPKLDSRLSQRSKEYERRAAEHIKKEMVKADVAISIDNASLLKVLDDGVYRNQFASGVGAGADFNDFLDFKRQVEFDSWGTPFSAKPKDRVIFGSMIRKDNSLNRREFKNTSWYSNGDKGNTTVIVLKDKVRKRTTIIEGDSFIIHDTARDRVTVPLNAPSTKMLSPKDDNILVFGGKEARPISKLWSRDTYIEAQISGGVGLDDIASIKFEKSPDNILKLKLKEKGIKWEIIRR